MRSRALLGIRGERPLCAPARFNASSKCENLDAALGCTIETHVSDGDVLHPGQHADASSLRVPTQAHTFSALPAQRKASAVRKEGEPQPSQAERRPSRTAQGAQNYKRLAGLRDAGSEVTIVRSRSCVQSSSQSRDSDLTDRPSSIGSLSLRSCSLRARIVAERRERPPCQHGLQGPRGLASRGTRRSLEAAQATCARAAGGLRGRTAR